MIELPIVAKGQPQQGPLYREATKVVEVQLPRTAQASLCKVADFHEPRLWLHELAELGLPQAEEEDAEAGHLLDVVRIQTVTRQEARTAAQEENPLVENIAENLLATIIELQKTDPLCLRISRELSTRS